MATALVYNGGRQLNTNVSEQEFREAEKAYNALELTEVITPQTDVKIIEEMLGVAPGTFDDYAFHMKASPNSCCKGCRRELNWLDVCHTALKVPGHTREFILGTFEGEHGRVLAPPFRHLTCFNCNTVQDSRREHIVRGYNCKGYMCQGG
ncbi:hypothetical protein Vretimale_15014 [Volvox reticuliferus]|uniref:Uncharacterized protein n=2 Tax=Volvox reticuliferus TaxID=1737510 RepID=A0A8J4GQE4_9CHLO|nr:hypothetical protein Vretimale_15014 [Volvox reticuliferus]